MILLNGCPNIYSPKSCGFQNYIPRCVCVYISMANIRLIIFIYRISIMYHFSNRSNRGRAHRYNKINLYYREVVHNLIYKCDASSILSSCMLIL